VDFDPPVTDRGEDFTVTIDFSNAVAAVNEYPKISLAGATLDGEDTTLEVLSARRSVQDSVFNEFKRFNVAAFEAGDVGAAGDVTTTDVLNEIKNYYYAGVVCFAVSWGIDANATRVYSIPEWLGFEKITFPRTESTW